MPGKKNNKWQGLLILIIPVLVVLAVYLLFPSSTEQRDQLLASWGTRNFGTLVSPQQQLGLADLSEQLSSSGKWKLVIADDGSCGADCRESLYITRQIHKLMPKRSNRIERVLLSSGELSAEVQLLLQQEYPALVQVNDQQGQWPGLRQQSNLGDLQGGYVLVDPEGWLVMYYQSSDDYKKVIKDMKVLL